MFSWMPRILGSIYSVIYKQASDNYLHASFALANKRSQGPIPFLVLLAHVALSDLGKH